MGDNIEDICKSLSEEIKIECSAEVINTERIRMLTFDLEKFKSLSVTSVEQVPGLIDNYQLTRPPRIVGNNQNNLPVNVNNAGNNLFDSLKDVAHEMLKKQEEKMIVDDVDKLFYWWNSLGNISSEMIDRDIMTCDELKNIENSILKSISNNMKTRIDNMLRISKNIEQNIDMEE